MGCKMAVSSGISWFFEQEEEGIVLEDDIVVHPDFFPYCADLLERYRHDTRVWCISGNNFHNGQWRGDGTASGRGSHHNLRWILRYNHDDVRATWAVACWLLEQDQPPAGQDPPAPLLP